MKVILNIVKFILIMLLTLVFIGFVFVNIISATVLNKEYVLEKLEESAYYEQIKIQIESNFENYIGQSGLDEDVIKGIISVEQIKEDTNNIISNIYDGTQLDINTETVKANLRNNINKSLENRNLTTIEKSAIEEYINKISDQYKEYMLHTKYESNINNILQRVEQCKNVGSKAIIITAFILSLLIFVSNYKNIIKGISNIGIALVSSAVFCIFIKIYIECKIKIENIVILNDAISMTLKNVINDILSKIINYGFILLGIGILAVIVANIVVNLKNGEKRGEQE